MKALLILIGCLASVSSFATGSTTCNVETSEIKLNVNLTNGIRFGNPLLDTSTIEAKIKSNGLVVGLSEYTFKGITDIPFWFNLNNELKLGAYAEPTDDGDGNPIDAFVSLAVVIDAKARSNSDGPDDFVGTYKIIQESNSAGPGSMTKEFSGPIVCSVE